MSEGFINRFWNKNIGETASGVGIEAVPQAFSIRETTYEIASNPILESCAGYCGSSARFGSNEANSRCLPCFKPNLESVDKFRIVVSDKAKTAGKRIFPDGCGKKSFEKLFLTPYEATRRNLSTDS